MTEEEKLIMGLRIESIKIFMRGVGNMILFSVAVNILLMQWPLIWPLVISILICILERHLSYKRILDMYSRELNNYRKDKK